ncbi:XRE family transcriptional regulator [Bombilactobacillus bombi]|uniref:helix-turn-helix domain-containing protein n=1 Tax=Bombilactobacillus bombi TaxID=1303590 RepID=UPI000E572E79|nr:helix-turn-helix transcriptional regulator [Bombilactobacillus bombi]AXX64251.1 XRE family transcriptional regulator [Bombilactobacillus bombi]
MNDHELIINRLYKLLSERNLTINRLATLSGVSQSTIASLINRPTGVPKADTLRQLCSGLGISVVEFFDFSPYNEVEK